MKNKKRGYRRLNKCVFCNDKWDDGPVISQYVCPCCAGLIESGSGKISGKKAQLYYHWKRKGIV